MVLMIKELLLWPFFKSSEITTVLFPLPLLSSIQPADFTGTERVEITPVPSRTSTALRPVSAPSR